MVSEKRLYTPGQRGRRPHPCRVRQRRMLHVHHVGSAVSTYARALVVENKRAVDVSVLFWLVWYMASEAHTLDTRERTDRGHRQNRVLPALETPFEYINRRVFGT